MTLELYYNTKLVNTSKQKYVLQYRFSISQYAFWRIVAPLLGTISWDFSPFQKSQMLLSVSSPLSYPYLCPENYIFKCTQGYSDHGRNRHGVVYKPLALYPLPRDPEFDSQLLKSVRLDSKLWPHLHITLAVDGTLNTNSLTLIMAANNKDLDYSSLLSDCS